MSAREEGAFTRALDVKPPRPRMTPPKQAIEDLKSNPRTLKQFEETFGLNPGEGRQYLLK